MNGKDRPGRTGQGRGSLATLYLMACNTLVIFLLLELLTRASIGLYRMVRGKSDPTASPSFGEEVHPFLQNTSAPGPEVDAGPRYAGFIVDPKEPKEPAPADDRCRVLFLGGSTLAFDVPQLVRLELDRHGVPSRAYNLAVPWHSSLHSLYKLWTYGDLIAPHLVVVLDNANDFYRGFTSPHYSLPEYREDYSHYLGGLHPYWRSRPSAYDGRPTFLARPLNQEQASLAGALQGVVRSSALLVRARQLVASLGAPPVEVVHMEPEVYLRSLPAFRRNLANLRAGCAVKGVPALFLSMPFTLETSSRFLLEPGRFFSNDGRRSLADADFADGMRAFNQAALELADEPRAFVLDLAAAFADPALFADEVHLTMSGKEREAALIAAAILERGLLAGCAGLAPGDRSASGARSKDAAGEEVKVGEGQERVDQEGEE